MYTLLYNGDHHRDARGLPVSLTGSSELVQRALIRLCVRKGSFTLDPALGSELYRLSRPGDKNNDRLALAYAQEALAGLPGVSLQEVACVPRPPDGLLVRVTLNIQGEPVALEVAV